MNQPEESGIEERINGIAQKRVLNFRPQNQAGQQRRGCRGTRYKDFSLSTRFFVQFQSTTKVALGRFDTETGALATQSVGGC
jgi:hypothetical protein